MIVILWAGDIICLLPVDPFEVRIAPDPPPVVLALTAKLLHHPDCSCQDLNHKVKSVIHVGCVFVAVAIAILNNILPLNIAERGVS